MRCPRCSWGVYLLGGVVWMEVTLQIFAFGYRQWATSPRLSPNSRTEFTILCLGDSVTVGYGADSHHSYPRQMERMLKDRWPDRTVQVLNGGKGAVNSSWVLDRLPSQLRKARPDLVLLMTGGNDDHRFQSIDLATLSMGSALRLRSLKNHLEQWLSVSKLYSLASLVIAPKRKRDAPPRASQTPTVEAAGAPVPLSTKRLLVEIGKVLEATPEAARQLLRNADRTSPMPWSVKELSEEVLPWVQRALQEVPRDFEALVRLARLFRYYHRDGVAQQVYEMALATASSERDALLVQAERSMERREFTRLPSFWEQLIEQDPTNSKLHLKLAFAQNGEGAFDDAVASAYRALALNPDTALAYSALTRVFSKQKKFEQAQAMGRRAVELDPLNGRLWFFFARASRTLGEVNVAREAWREGFRWTHEPDLLARLGQSYQNLAEGRETMRALLEEEKSSSIRGAAYWEPSEQLVAYHGRTEQLGKEILARNLERAINQLTTQHVRLALITYPNLPKDHWENRVVRWVAARHPAVLLIDAAGVLSDRFANPTQEYMSPNGTHPNAQGYRLLARYILETLEAAGALDMSGQHSTRVMSGPDDTDLHG